MTKLAKIKIKSKGLMGTVILNREDVSSQVARCEVIHQADQLPVGEPAVFVRRQ